MKLNITEDNVFDYIIMKLKNNEADSLLNEMEELINENINLKNILLSDTIDYIKSLVKPREINTIQDLAKLLNHNWNGDELKNPYNIDVEQLCKEKKWVILFPYSDDNIEIRGYVWNELGAYNGGEFKLIKRGEFYNDPEDDDIEIYRKAKNNELVSCKDDPHIFMKWCDEKHKPYIWYIDTDYTDAAYFEILDEDSEENEIWAHCCIIDCSNILD